MKMVIKMDHISQLSFFILWFILLLTTSIALRRKVITTKSKGTVQRILFALVLYNISWIMMTAYITPDKTWYGLFIIGAIVVVGFTICNALIVATMGPVVKKCHRIISDNITECMSKSMNDY